MRGRDGKGQKGEAVTVRGADHRRRLVRLWMDLGLGRREAQQAADEDLRVADVFRQQGMSEAQIRQALQKLRAVFDLIEVDPRTGRARIVTGGPSIFDLVKTPTRKRPKGKTRKDGV